MKLSSKGFTLVELAIVMTIIGLLIGGILKGQELLYNAKTKRTVKDVQSFQAALLTFQDVYSGKPGDITTATSRLQNCTPANNCVNGNGDNLIGPLIHWWQITDQSRLTENQQLWTHLALAGMISGVDTSTRLGWGYSHPISPLDGGYTALQARQGGVQRFGKFESDHGLWIRLMANLVGNPAANNEVISPHDAFIIDRKYDDGDPWAGWIRATGWGVAAIGAPNTCEGEYDETSKQRTCIFGFILN